MVLCGNDKKKEKKTEKQFIESQGGSMEKFVKKRSAASVNSSEAGPSVAPSLNPHDHSNENLDNNVNESHENMSNPSNMENVNVDDELPPFDPPSPLHELADPQLTNTTEKISPSCHQRLVHCYSLY